MANHQAKAGQAVPSRRLSRAADSLVGDARLDSSRLTIAWHAISTAHGVDAHCNKSVVSLDPPLMARTMEIMRLALGPQVAAIVLTFLGLTAACAAPASSIEIMPTTIDGARQLARTVASKGGCEGFEDHSFTRASDTWVFTCQKPGLSFEVVAYGSAEAKSVAIKGLGDRNQPYFTKSFYSVAVVHADPNGAAESALAAFKQ